MTDQQHPITPPPELIREWNEEAATAPMADQRYIAIQAARWGADQELEACVEHLKRIWSPSDTIDSLCTARRPKPPSLTVRALAALAAIEGDFNTVGDRADIIRRALERLQELEKGSD